MAIVRIAILAAAAIVAAAAYVAIRSGIPVPDLQHIRLAELYGALSMALLYVALSVSPIYAVFPRMPGRALLVHARRAIGVCAFGFALLHTGIAFFELLAGWRGIAFLSGPYVADLSRSFAALIVLGALAGTSTDWAARKLGKSWKTLHRLAYPAALVILWHTITLGSHFVRPESAFPIVTFVLVSFLVLLESVRLDRWLASAFPAAGNLGAAFATAVFGIAACGFLYFGGASGLSIHSEHASPSAKGAR